MPTRVLHVMGSAEQAGTSIASLVRILALHLDHAAYELEACFLGAPGPWTEALHAAGVPAFAVPWSSPRDLSGAWRFWRFLRSRSVNMLHLHYGGRSVRGLARAATRAPLVVHLHGRVRNEADLELVQLQLDDADAVVATSQA